MIKALMYRHIDRDSGTESQGATPWAADFIENKGDGQIFLLHGSPGVGKTYVCFFTLLVHIRMLTLKQTAGKSYLRDS
jgi:hypothetical protein